jgi:hypothetical protein
MSKKGGIMKFCKWMVGWPALGAVVFFLALASCASQPMGGDADDALAGAQMGRELAKEDGIAFECFKFSRTPGGYPSLEVRQDYRSRFQEEGRSEAFIRGFLRDYDKTFRLYVSNKCSS